MGLNISKNDFEHALIDLGLSKKDWINEYEISYEWLRKVLNKKGHSERIKKAIFETILEAKKRTKMRRNVKRDSLGERIAYYLKKAGKKQYELAEFCETDPPHVSKWINNKVKPTSENLSKIADFCHCTLNELVGSNPREQKPRQTEELRFFDKIEDTNDALDSFDDELESIMSFVTSHLLLKAIQVQDVKTKKQAESYLEQNFKREKAILEHKLNSLPLFFE